ncbi:ABC transporter ATP-binding protein [Candidatus Uhrbacteria bacterium]|nr:ABC transporter ATP-binding protein [Candidatus Uhrbacteria bacterium]
MNGNRKKQDISFSWVDLARAYWQLLGERRWKYLFLQTCLTAILFYQVVPPLVVGLMVDFFSTYHVGDSLTLFYVYTVGLGISFVVVSLVRLSIKWITGNYLSEIKYEAKVKGFERLLDHSLMWHFQETAGAKAQRIKNGVDALRDMSYKFNNEILRSATSLVGMIGVFIFLRPAYGLFFLVYTCCFFSILRYFYRRIQHENDLYYTSLEAAGGTYVEGLSNIVTIKTLGAGSDFREHVAQKEQRTKKHEITIRAFVNNLWKSFQAFNGLCYGVFLLIVGADIIAGRITAGALVIFYGYLFTLINNAADIMDTYEIILNAKSGIGRMMSIFWAPSVGASGKKKFPVRWDAITVKDVSFSYGKDTTTISRVSFAVPRTAHVGIVGKTGSGKSTVAKLLAGLYPISEGDYRIGDTPFHDISREEQIHHMTLLLQETEIFNFSLRDNITLMKAVDGTRIEKALEIAQLTSVVASLPDGLDTLVGEKGYHLSGGERQRVGIARALCRDAEILIFDEATSSLDTKTEAAIQEAIERELVGKTVIIIAHRVSTLQHVDRIYVFDEGKIVEDGTFAELSHNTHSRFYELYHRQNT